MSVQTNKTEEGANFSEVLRGNESIKFHEGFKSKVWNFFCSLFLIVAPDVTSRG